MPPLWKLFVLCCISVVCSSAETVVASMDDYSHAFEQLLKISGAPENSRINTVVYAGSGCTPDLPRDRTYNVGER